MQIRKFRSALLLLLVPKACSLWKPRQTAASNQPDSGSLKQDTSLNVKTSTKESDDVSKYGLALWIAALSGFIVRNSRSSVSFWPASLLKTPHRVLMLVHQLSAMAFAGTILATTLLEWVVVQSKESSVHQFWFTQAPRVEMALVLPGLTGFLVSGVALAFQNYGSLVHAPFHIQWVMHLLTWSGLWWGLTDVTTQSKALDAATMATQDSSNAIPRVLLFRRFSNLVSCGFLAALYAIMVLKPSRSMIRGRGS